MVLLVREQGAELTLRLGHHSTLRDRIGTPILSFFFFSHSVPSQHLVRWVYLHLSPFADAAVALLKNHNQRESVPCI